MNLTTVIEKNPYVIIHKNSMFISSTQKWVGCSSLKFSHIPCTSGVSFVSSL